MKRFGTFDGVFTPTVLTILGVIMYLRLGWVVGNAGLLGALIIILLSKAVTLSTGLAMSSMASNIRIGAGGAYTFIARSLGLEAGGSIGIPLYIAQVLSAALYIIGFAEGWRWFFPDHNVEVVGLVAWFVLTSISFYSANFAIKIQYVIMAIIAVSLFSFGLGKPLSPDITASMGFGNFEDASFWQVFAVFFPAATGIMAGIALSGELRNPKRAIPIGSLSAIVVTMVIYCSLAFGLAKFASPEALRDNPLIMADISAVGSLVIAGIMGATLSSALATMVGAPRVLQALAQEDTVPLSRFLAKTSKSHEPRVASALTSVGTVTALLTTDLNQLATLITMFFLITYGMINLVVFIEQSMKFIGFRPSFRIPRFVPLFGAVSCFGIMFLIDAAFSVVSGLTVVFLYFVLNKRKLRQSQRDIRAGLFQFLAERATHLAAQLPRQQVSWKPDLLVPVENPEAWHDRLGFIKDIVAPSGSVYMFTVKEQITEERITAMKALVKPVSKQRVLASATVIEGDDFIRGCKTVVQTLKGTPFRPNTLFLTLGQRVENDGLIQELFRLAHQNEMGVMFLRAQPTQSLAGGKGRINLWLRDRSTNWHLAILTALQLQLNWEGKLQLITVAPDESEVGYLRGFLERLCDLARIPASSELHVLQGGFQEVLKNAPEAELNIFGIGGSELPLEFMRHSADLLNTPCIFVKDSGLESALV